MTLFRYEAVDRAGKVVRGVMNASSEQEVVQNLVSRGFAARAVFGGSSTAAPGRAVPPASAPYAQQQPRATAAAVTVSGGIPISIRSKIPAGRLAMFYRQLATLVRSGVPLSQSFGDLVAATRDSRLRRAVPLIQQELISGRALSGALAAYPDLFPAHSVGMVWCAELGGTLDVTLDEIASDIEQEAADTRMGRIGWGLTKISAFFLVLTFPLYNIERIIEPIVSGTGTDSRAYMRSIVDSAVSDVCHKSILPALVLVVLWIVWGHIKRIPSVRSALDALLLSVPVWGKLHRYRSIGRFAHVLDQLYAAGANPQTAWDAASVAPRNSEIVRRLRAARAMASTATGVAELAASSGLLEPEEVALITAGHRTGQVPEALSKVAMIYSQKAEAQKALGRVLSISLLTSGQIAAMGAGLILMASSYKTGLTKLGL